MRARRLGRQMRLDAGADLAVDRVALQDQDLAQRVPQPWLAALGAAPQHLADEQLDFLTEAVHCRTAAAPPCARLEPACGKRFDVGLDLLADQAARIVAIVAGTAGPGARGQEQQDDDQDDAERQHALRGHGLSPFRRP